LKHLAATIDNGWSEFLLKELSEPYAEELGRFLEKDARDYTLCPDQADWFRAYAATDPDSLSVVMIGQDPYFNGEAMGLSFSVKPGYKLTPSVRNILKEVTGTRDVKHYSGNLQSWSDQGVLMLNSCLTTRKGLAGAHSKKGWETLTSRTVERINTLDHPVVYLAWGKWAHKVVSCVDNPKHLVIRTSHPSPLGAMKSGDGFSAFTGSGCFDTANQFLKEQGRDEIDWQGGLEHREGALI